MAHYRITPLEKKSIYVVYEMYRENDDGSISWFNVEDHYRWGKGFIAEDMDCNLSPADSPTQYCKAEDGEYEGCEFDDQVACYFEFSDDLSEEEQEQIKTLYLEGNDDGVCGAGWLFDGEHEWEEEDSYVVVLGPYKVEFCDEQGDVIREVKLLTQDEWLKLYEERGSYASKDSGLENAV
jgi:hypothetical protein